MIDEKDPAFLLRQGLQRLELLRALASGLGRHQEITAAVAACDDRQQATRAVADLLGVGDLGATAVLDLQWSRLTREESRRLHEQIAELETSIEGWRHHTDLA